MPGEIARIADHVEERVAGAGEPAKAKTLADEVGLAARIAGQLQAAGIDPDDKDYAELLASECDVQDRLRRIVRAARYAAADADTLDTMIDGMRERKARFEKKSRRLRDVVASAMDECGLKRIDAPDFTASLAIGKPKVLITDESALPDDVCVVKREPSKTAIAAWISEKSACPGAELSNAAPTLTVRTR